MLLAALDQIDSTFLAQLCQEKCPESDTLDFKRELPGSGDPDGKRELLKDVAAFANADGGDLVYGVADVDGHAEALAPLKCELADEATRRVQQVLDAGLDPRVQGLRFRAVPLDGGFALIVRVPASFSGPHSIRANTNRRFVIRNGTTTSDLTMDQLRAAFDRSSSLPVQVREWIGSRYRTINLDSLGPPKELDGGPLVVLHVVPVAGVAGRKVPDLQAMESGRRFSGLNHPEWGGLDWSFNLDGLLLFPGSRTSDEPRQGYTQLFRSGAIEAAEVCGLTWGPQGQPERDVIPSRPLAEFVLDQVGGMLHVLRDEWGYVGPAVVALNIIGARGFALLADDRSFMRKLPTADRSELAVPPVWINELSTAEVDAVVRPMLDIVWQSFGHSRCWEFDLQSGKLVQRG